MNIRILLSLVSVIPLVWAFLTRTWDPYVYVVFGARIGVVLFVSYVSRPCAWFPDVGYGMPTAC